MGTSKTRESFSRSPIICVQGIETSSDFQYPVRMSMGIPYFFLFAVYGVVNAYLPIFLFSLGYSATHIGLLQGIFEASGLFFPFFISSKVDKNGNYGFIMVSLGLLMVILLPPLVYLPNFWITAILLSLFAIGFKGIVPVSDALVSRRLGPGNNGYGQIRVLGSIGFVFITLLLQFTQLINVDSPFSIALWIGLPSILFSLSIIVIPGLLKKIPPVLHQTETTPDVALKENGLRVLKQFPFAFWIGIALIFLGFLGMTPFARFFSLYVQEFLHIQSYAGLWALAAAAEVPFMFFSGFFIKRYGAEKIIVLSLFAICIRNIIYVVFPTFGGAIAGQLLHSICFGLFHPAAVVFVCHHAPKKLIAVALTLYSSVAVGVGSVIGNVIGGMIIDSFGYQFLFIFFAIFPFLGILLYLFFKKRLLEQH